MQRKVTEERLQGGHHHPHTLFQGITRLQGGGGGEVVLVGEEGGRVPCHALLLAAASPLLCQLLCQDGDQEEMVVLLPAKIQAIERLVSRLYGNREGNETVNKVEIDELATLLGIQKEFQQVQHLIETTTTTTNTLPEARAEADTDPEVEAEAEADKEIVEKSVENQSVDQTLEVVGSECGECGKSFSNGRKLKQHESKCGAEHRYTGTKIRIYQPASVQVQRVWRQIGICKQPCSSHEEPHWRQAVCLRPV